MVRGSVVGVAVGQVVVLASESIDHIMLPVNDSIWVVNLFLFLVVFGVAIDLDLDEFRETLRRPKGPLIGMVGQLLILPAATWGLTMLLRPHPSVALGMLLVASVPGGAISNFITHLGNGNASLSIGMTGLSTVTSVAMTPLNLSLWARLNPDTRAILDTGVSVSPTEMIVTIMLLLGLPVGLGWLTQVRWPRVAARLARPARILSTSIIVLFVVGALASNLSAAPAFLSAVGTIIIGVVVHNALGLTVGYGLATATRLPRRDRRAVAFEVGMQNSALALGLSLSFFPELGGAAVVAATYGIWHAISGLAIAAVWRRQDRVREVRGLSAAEDPGTR